MGTYITIKVKEGFMNDFSIRSINALWNKANPDFEDTFHLANQNDMDEWLYNIHNDPELIHLRYNKTTDDLNKTFSVWGLGTFQVKITMGDYLCSEMARRYSSFFGKYADKYFEKNPVDDGHIRTILNEKANDNHIAEDCGVECVGCSK